MAHEGQTGIYFESDGCRLLGTLFLTLDESPKPTALLLHGLPGIEKNYDLAHALRTHGWNSAIVHYRGCWGSEGAYRFDTIPTDVHAALDALCSGRYPQVDSGRIVLIGHSLGGWVAVLAAAEDTRAKAVAVYATVASPRLLQFSADEADAEFTPWLHGITSESLVAQWNALGDELDPLEQVSRLAPRPLLVLHGGADPVVSASDAEALFERARDPKELVIAPDAGHAWSWHRQELRSRLLEWLSGLAL